MPSRPSPPPPPRGRGPRVARTAAVCGAAHEHDFARKKPKPVVRPAARTSCAAFPHASARAIAARRPAAPRQQAAKSSPAVSSAACLASAVWFEEREHLAGAQLQRRSRCPRGARGSRSRSFWLAASFNHPARRMLTLYNSPMLNGVPTIAVIIPSGSLLRSQRARQGSIITRNPPPEPPPSAAARERRPHQQPRERCGTTRPDPADDAGDGRARGRR